jgi:lysophospholipase L1-like esterase
MRLLEQSPALEDHAVNAAQPSTNVNDLRHQLDEALGDEPSPDLVIVQSVDNDVQCDGADDANYAEYAGKMTAVLQKILDAAPDARIYVVGEWATEQNYADILAGRPDLVTANTGSGLCDLFDASGAERPDAITAVQQILDRYSEELRSVCAQFPSCTPGGDEIRNLVITDADLTPDGNHLTIPGQKKLADAAWSVIGTLAG